MGTPPLPPGVLPAPLPLLAVSTRVKSGQEEKRKRGDTSQQPSQSSRPNLDLLELEMMRLGLAKRVDFGLSLGDLVIEAPQLGGAPGL